MIFEQQAVSDNTWGGMFWNIAVNQLFTVFAACITQSTNILANCSLIIKIVLIGNESEKESWLITFSRGIC